MAPTPDKTRRPGYAPAANVGVGRRGLHTRDRILSAAAKVFLSNGFHATSLDAIAKAANASRATVYQYFSGKEDIFRELSAAAERDVLDHGERLGGLGPTVAGVEALHSWLTEWADIYDAHAAAFAEYPGIGTELAVVDVGSVATTLARTVTARVLSADLGGLAPDTAAAALMRIPHMVNLYRYRSMFPLPDRTVTVWSLTVTLQLMLFPDTTPKTLRAPASAQPLGNQPAARTTVPPASAPVYVVDPLSPIERDVLSAGSTLFAERGYYAVGMEDIASAAGISRATLYRYFSTKVDILAELTRQAVREVEKHAATLPPTADADAWRDWMLGYVRFHREYRGVIRAWLDGTVADQLTDASVDHGIGAIHGAIGARLGSADLPPGVDRDVASAVFLAVLGRMTEPLPAGDASDEDAAELMTTLLLRSLLR